MAVPKRKVSKRMIRQRRASHKFSLIATKPCPNCKAPQRPHRVCASCGYYRGRQVRTITTD